MSKKLSEMSLEELWQLFPIYLTEHDEKWDAWFYEESQRLCALLSNSNIKARISHIGSTAIKSIWAKPIIDILIEIPLENDISKVKDLIVHNGYLCMAENTQRASFNKGYTENGFAEKVFHLHLRYWGDNDELYFRDYMNSNPILAKEYEKLKLELWKLYVYDRDGYTNAKHGFISEHTRKAKEVITGNLQANRL